MRVPIYPVAHAFRAGSRIRVTVQATGGDRPRWDFATLDRGRTRNTIALGGARASSLVLPVLAGARARAATRADRAARAAEPGVQTGVERRLRPESGHPALEYRGSFR